EKRRAARRLGAASWGKPDGGEPPPEAREPVPVGQRLGEARRLVILGDPGAGKTTMIRWIATAYLLRLKNDPDLNELPDVATLPEEHWLPVIIRCRDLDRSALGGSLEDVLSHTLRRQEISQAERNALVTHLTKKLGRGEALLLLDGLDEITEPALRVSFSQQLENIHIAYPKAPMIATSRIVGYREMGYRIGRGFEHVTVADLSREDKDDFARRWCAVVETPERRERMTEELIHDIHSSDRIERLTGNPMLLTTMALVKRKVGRLPNRRVDLYASALDVLLNWRREVDEPVDDKEAVPQLEYLAYAMCERGVQQLREDEILELLERMRGEYPQIHPLKKHTPEEFLRLLERRTGLLVEVGHVRHDGLPVPVFEFRHLTFQEYLAGLALVAGHFPGRDRARTLAENIAPLAGRTGEVRDPESGWSEIGVTENWREALRLCVASCNDDFVDGALKAILTPLESEDAQTTTHPRSVMAALCLADEPNASEGVALTALDALVMQIKRQPDESTTPGVKAAAKELGSSRWGNSLRAILAQEFCRRDGQARENWGSLCSNVATSSAPRDETGLREWLALETSRIAHGSETEAVDAALGIMGLAYADKAFVVPGMIEALMSMLKGNAPSACAAAWSLGWLNGGYEPRSSYPWLPSATELEQVIIFFANPESDREGVRFVSWILDRANYLEPLTASINEQDIAIRQAAMKVLSLAENAWIIESLKAKLNDEDSDTLRAAARVLGWSGNAAAVEAVLDCLDRHESNWPVAAEALIQIGDTRAVEQLATLLDDPDGDMWETAARLLASINDSRALEPAKIRLTSGEESVRISAVGILAQAVKDEIDRTLLSKDLDALEPFFDPQQEIDEERVNAAAANLEMPTEEVRRRYEALAGQFSLRLAWLKGDAPTAGQD
ncbi:MAG: NACHT domain-containing protein, partial [Acidobacteria bacterium]|nr:NACHT domain-containing protein [Acidobacteriota bacterium]